MPPCRVIVMVDKFHNLGLHLGWGRGGRVGKQRIVLALVILEIKIKMQPLETT